jgi:hypothetical protein
MPKRPIFTAIFALIMISAVGAVSAREASGQNVRTLVGEWIVRSTPINGETASRLGNTLGFPDRDMSFREDGEIRTGLVAREDVGTKILNLLACGALMAINSVPPFNCGARIQMPLAALW